VIDAGDYTYWRNRFGNLISGAGTVASIPEPTTEYSLYSFLGVGLVAFRRTKVARRVPCQGKLRLE
jgi:hypothetical protein